MKNKILLLPLLFISQPAFSEKLIPIGGLYYDNINDANIKIGGAYLLDRVEKEVDIKGENISHFQYSNYIFTDYTKSSETNAFSLGWGRHYGEGSYRIGISQISEDDIRYSGIEGTFTAFFFSFKAGIYQNNDTNDAEFLIGAGLGW